MTVAFISTRKLCPRNMVLTSASAKVKLKPYWAAADKNPVHFSKVTAEASTIGSCAETAPARRAIKSDTDLIFY